MGCCGREYGEREEIEKAVWQNTHEFNRSPGRLSFRERQGAKFLRSCGVCRQVIFTSQARDAVTCPLHPQENGGKDLRVGHCDIRYLCKAAVLFSEWDEKTRDAFVSFIHHKDLDWFTFSMGMDSDALVDEFLETYG